jgi:carbamoyl-phosphate synthase large subunit
MTTVAVTGLSSFLGAPGTGVIYALRLSGDKSLRIIGMDYSPFSDGLFGSQMDSAYAIPSPKRRKEFLRRLEEITKIEKIDVMIPSLDAEVILLSKIRGIIELLGIKTMIPEAECVTRVRDKVSQLGFLQECEIPHPTSRVGDLSSDPVKLTKDMRFPVLIKCEEGAFPAFNAEEVRVIAKRLRKKFVVQEYVEGDEYSICLLAYPKGEIYGYVIQKKMAQSDIGATLVGVTVDRQDVLDISRDFVRKLGWIGPMELEFRGVDELYLTDINLRFPAWVSLTAAAGVNLPYAAVQLALGRRYEVGKQRTGVVIVRTVRDVHINIFDLFKFSKSRQF